MLTFTPNVPSSNSNAPPYKALRRSLYVHANVRMQWLLCVCVCVCVAYIVDVVLLLMLCEHVTAPSPLVLI